jgi:hypothetical protein
MRDGDPDGVDEVITARTLASADVAPRPSEVDTGPAPAPWILDALLAANRLAG